MFANLVHAIKQTIHTRMAALRHYIAARTKPTTTSLVRGSLRDLVRTKPQLDFIHLKKKARHGRLWF